MDEVIVWMVVIEFLEMFVGFCLFEFLDVDFGKIEEKVVVIKVYLD